MDKKEARMLRNSAELRAFQDLKAGRVGGPLAWAVVDTALSTGLRVAEMAALRVGDVDLKRHCLRVTRLKRAKPSTESLAIPPELAEHLRDFIAWKANVGDDTGRDSRLFAGKRGPLTAQGLQQIWRKAVARAGLPKELSIHSARHTVAVHLLSKTKNLRQVQKQLGHASPATTANMYADVSFDEMQNGMAGLYEDVNQAG